MINYRSFDCLKDCLYYSFALDVNLIRTISSSIKPPNNCTHLESGQALEYIDLHTYVHTPESYYADRQYSSEVDISNLRTCIEILRQTLNTPSQSVPPAPFPFEWGFLSRTFTRKCQHLMANDYSLNSRISERALAQLEAALTHDETTRKLSPHSRLHAFTYLPTFEWHLQKSSLKTIGKMILIACVLSFIFHKLPDL